MDYLLKLIDKKPGVRGAFDRVIFRWLNAPKSKRGLKFLLAYYYIKKIYPIYQRVFAKLTAHFPFSLLDQTSLNHFKNIKARDLMRGMEKVAKEASIPVFINDGSYFDRYFSVLYGKFERGGINKQEALKKLQEVFQEKYGDVYLQEEEVGFKVLVSNKLLI